MLLAVCLVVDLDHVSYLVMTSSNVTGTKIVSREFTCGESPFTIHGV